MASDYRLLEDDSVDPSFREFIKDEAFLLRCASKYQWEALIDRCALIHDLFSTPASNDEPFHKLQVAAASKQLLARDEWNNTALHLACFHNPPTQAVMSLLEAARAGGSSSMELTSLLTADSSSPLLIACATGASSSTIRMLLNPPGNQMARVSDDAGETPLSQLLVHYEKQHKSRSTGPALQEAKKSDRYDSQVFLEFMTNCQQILLAGWHATPGEFFSSILQGAANMAESCPRPLTQLLCRWYPDMISNNSEGLYPLHLAIRSGHFQHKKLREQQADMIGILLEYYPQAASVCFPNSKRSLLCEAIVMRLDWQLQDSGNDGPLLKLWNCNREALQEKDAATGLYPCLLAAATTEDDHNSEEDASKLNNVYNLLRLYPQVVYEALRRDG